MSLQTMQALDDFPASSDAGENPALVRVDTTLVSALKTLNRFTDKDAAWAFIDDLCRGCQDRPQLPIHEQHTFTGEGDHRLYARTVTMPAGSMVVSHIHETQHQFVIQIGMVAVWTFETGWRYYRGPYHGVTEPSTRRVLFNLTDTVWTTFHATQLTDPEEIGRVILQNRALCPGQPSQLE